MYQLDRYGNSELFYPPHRRLQADFGKERNSQAAVLVGFPHYAIHDFVVAPFPTDRDALRIVQYDSCRGLEGWTVINYAFDDFYDYKYEQWLSSPQDLGGLFDTKEELAKAFAAQWLMIPMTRAMDTLVLNISRRPSKIKTVLQSVSEARPDFVDWIEI